MKRIMVWLEIALAMAALNGCTMYKIGGRGTIPIMLNSPRAKVDLLKHIKVSKMVVFDYTSSFDVSEILGEAIEQSKADAIVNVTIEGGGDFGTFFLNLFTLGIANAHTIRVEGDLVKAPNGLGFLSIPGSQVLAEAATLKDLTTKAREANEEFGPSIMVARTASGFALIRYNINQLDLSK